MGQGRTETMLVGSTDLPSLGDEPRPRCDLPFGQTQLELELPDPRPRSGTRSLLPTSCRPAADQLPICSRPAAAARHVLCADPKPRTAHLTPLALALCVFLALLRHHLQGFIRRPPPPSPAFVPLSFPSVDSRPTLQSPGCCVCSAFTALLLQNNINPGKTSRAVFQVRSVSPFPSLALAAKSRLPARQCWTAVVEAGRS